MSKTLNELVREQILAEGPQLESDKREWYVAMKLYHMSNAELLERVSDALARITGSIDARNWL
jgi:hypothetical protein